MEIDSEVLKLGSIASRTLLYPILPQRMTEAELDALAGGQFGFDVIAGKLYPSMVRILERFGGGRFDSASKAKLQAWLAGWVNPPERYVIHHPVVASGQWWRIFRTTLFIQPDLEAAHEAARVLPQEDLEARYATVLGPAARERFETHHAWWEMVLATLRMGSWHIAVYSPRYQAFISPFILDAEDHHGDELKELRAEWSRPSFRLFLSADHEEAGVFDISRLIERGAYVELLGDLRSAPPFGATWGSGVTQTRPGNSEGWVITGVIHAWTEPDGTDHRRVYSTAEAPEVGGVAVDGPDPFRLVQSLFGATGWKPKGVGAEFMAPDRIGDLVRSSASALCGPTGDTPLLVPKEVFLDAILTHPGLIPVYGRVVSMMLPGA